MGRRNQSCCLTKPAQEQHLGELDHNKQRDKKRNILSFPAQANKPKIYNLGKFILKFFSKIGVPAQ